MNSANLLSRGLLVAAFGGGSLLAAAATSGDPRIAAPAGSGAVVRNSNSSAPARILLRGTIVYSDPDYSEALLDFGSGELLRARVGARLPDGSTLVEVGRQSIRVSNGGQVYEITFNNADGVPAAAGGEGASVVVQAAQDEPLLDPDARRQRAQVIRERWGVDVDSGPPAQLDDYSAQAADQDGG